MPECTWKTTLYNVISFRNSGVANVAIILVLDVTGGEKISGSTGFELRASGILFLHPTTELPNHMSVSLMIYHQIPVPSYIYPLQIYSLVLNSGDSETL